jgi:hypothetical protein
MKIDDTKFNLDDTVCFIHKDKIYTSKIRRISVNVTSWIGADDDVVLLREVCYSIDDVIRKADSNDNVFINGVEENKLFATKEELLQFAPIEVKNSYNKDYENLKTPALPGLQAHR